MRETKVTKKVQVTKKKSLKKTEDSFSLHARAKALNFSVNPSSESLYANLKFCALANVWQPHHWQMSGSRGVGKWLAAAELIFYTMVSYFEAAQWYYT